VAGRWKSDKAKGRAVQISLRGRAYKNLTATDPNRALL
jgi:hypothetical protein